jgi:hypothetical protein
MSAQLGGHWWEVGDKGIKEEGVWGGPRSLFQLSGVLMEWGGYEGLYLSKKSIWLDGLEVGR